MLNACLCFQYSTADIEGGGTLTLPDDDGQCELDEDKHQVKNQSCVYKLWMC